MRKRAKGAGRPKQGMGAFHPLYTARMQRGLTLDDVSEQTRISKRSIQYWEDGTRLPSIIFANALAPVLCFQDGDALLKRCKAWQKERHP